MQLARTTGLKKVAHTSVHEGGKSHVTEKRAQSQSVPEKRGNDGEVVEKIGAKEQAAKETKMQDPSMPPVTPEMIVERWFVENAKVQLNAGSLYGTGGAGHMRMNLGTSRQLIAKACDNMGAALAKL